MLRFAPTAAQRAAELASHREAAAQFERALRFADGAEPALAAALQDGLADQYALLDRWEDAAAAGQRALELWWRAGDRLREGDTLRQLAAAMWRLCRGRSPAEAAEAALEVLEPLGPSAELAWACANQAGQRMMDGQHDAAIDLARQRSGPRRIARRARRPERCAEHRGLLPRRPSARTGAAAAQGAASRPRWTPAGTPRPGRASPNLSVLCARRDLPRPSRSTRDGSPTATTMTSPRSAVPAR